MSKETLELVSKLFAKLSDAYETLASEDAAAAVADPDDDLDEDLPAAKPAGKAKPAAKKPAAKKPAADDGDVTEQDIIDAATKLIKSTGSRNSAVKIIKKFGAEKVSELDEDVYPKVMAAIKAAQKAAAEPEEAADEDI